MITATGTGIEELLQATGRISSAKVNAIGHGASMTVGIAVLAVAAALAYSTATYENPAQTPSAIELSSQSLTKISTNCFKQQTPSTVPFQFDQAAFDSCVQEKKDQRQQTEFSRRERLPASRSLSAFIFVIMGGFITLINERKLSRSIKAHKMAKQDAQRIQADMLKPPKA